MTFPVRPPLAVLASLVDRGMLTLRLQKVHTHPMAPPCCVQVACLGLHCHNMHCSFQQASSHVIEWGLVQIMLSKADPQRLRALRDALHRAMTGSSVVRQPLQTLHPNVAQVIPSSFF